MVPGGDAVITIVSSLTGIFEQQQTLATARVEAKMQPLQELLDKRPWEAQANEVAARLTQMDHQYAMMKEIQRRELAEQIREQLQPNAKLQEDFFNNFRAEIKQALASGALDTETRQQLADLETKLDRGGLSMEEIIALLVAGGVPGAVALRAWAKTTQPSRAADDVKDHERRLSMLEGEVVAASNRIKAPAVSVKT